VSDRSLRILQVNTYDQWGGAEVIAQNLQRAYRRRGHDAWMTVGRRIANAPDTIVIPNDEGRSRWYRLWRGAGKKLGWLAKRRIGERIRNMVGGLADPARILDERRGVEVFRFPGTCRLLDLAPQRPDIAHAHNLHGNYFDLRALPWLSRQIPLVLTLHDAWLLSGHCSHSFDCDRWKTGCGQCPDLTIYPPIRRDATDYNWRRKRDIFSNSHLYIATPCRWLMDRVQQSMLAPAVVQGRVIPNGVDRSVFKPADRKAVRQELGISPDARVLLVVASGIRHNRFKNFGMARATAAAVAQKQGDRQTILIALGESGPSEYTGKAQVRFVAFESQALMIAKYYQASDLCLHATHADTFPNSILESLACGTPVVATAVGGIPEQIRSLNLPATASGVAMEAGDATGVLVAVGDRSGMTQAVTTLLENEDLCRKISQNAVIDVQKRFDLDHQCEAYLGWYESILKNWVSNQ